MNIRPFFKTSSHQDQTCSRVRKMDLYENDIDMTEKAFDPPKCRVRFSDVVESVCVESYKDMPLWWDDDELTGREIPAEENKDENANPYTNPTPFEVFVAVQDIAYKQLKVKGAVGTKVRRRLCRMLVHSEFRALEESCADGKIRGLVQKAERLAVIDLARVLQDVRDKDDCSAGCVGNKASWDTVETLAQFSQDLSKANRKWAKFIAELDTAACGVCGVWKDPYTAPSLDDEASVLAPTNTPAPTERFALKVFQIMRRRRARSVIALQRFGVDTSDQELV